MQGPPVGRKHSPIGGHPSPTGRQHLPIGGQYSPMETKLSPIEAHLSPMGSQHLPIGGQHSPMETKLFPMGEQLLPTSELLPAVTNKTQSEHNSTIPQPQLFGQSTGLLPTSHVSSTLFREYPSFAGT